MPLEAGFLAGLAIGVLLGVGAGVFVTVATAVWALRAGLKALLPVLGDWIARAMP